MANKNKQGWVYYLGGVLLSFLLFFSIVTHGPLNLHLPLMYDGDVFFTLLQIKTLALGDWYPFFPTKSQIAGAPYGFLLYDFPNADHLHHLLIKFLSFFSKDPVVLFNLFYFLTFPLSTLTFMYTARQFRVGYPAALVFGTLFAFLPFHLRRYPHLYLSGYFVLPLTVLVITWIWAKKPIFFKPLQSESPQSKDNDEISPNLKWCFTSKKALIAIAVALLTGGSGIYWSFFSLFFIAVAGVSALVYRKNWRHLASAFIIGTLMVGSAGIGGLSSAIYSLSHGKNRQITQRVATDAELYALKLIQIVLPQGNHRLQKMRTIRKNYESVTPHVEGADEAVGILSVLGFALLLPHLLILGKKRTILDKLSVLFICGLLLGTLGGLGGIFAKAITPMIRCYNRMSVYLALISLLSLAIGSQWLKMKFGKTKVAAMLLIALLVGIYDQITPDYQTAAINVQPEFDSDRDFIKQIESQLQSRGFETATILQLPYLPFPEVPPLFKMSDYSHFKAPLHSTTRVHWSYGAIVGRPGADEIRQLSQLPLSLISIKKMGYVGIYIDRFGFEDNGVSLEDTLRQMTHQEPLVSRNGRLSFFYVGS